MPKKVTPSQKRQKADEIRTRWITIVILLVVFMASAFRSGTIGIAIHGLQKWVLGDAYMIPVLLLFGIFALNTWRLIDGKKKESAVPYLLLSLVVVLFMAFVYSDDASFDSFSTTARSAGLYFTDQPGLNPGGGLVGSLLYGLISVALGRSIVLVVVILMTFTALYLLYKSELLHSNMVNAKERVSSFLALPEKPEPEEYVQEEPKPVVNLWKMLDERKERKAEAKKMQLPVPEEKDASDLYDDSDIYGSETENVPAYNDYFEKKPVSNVRRMMNITADGPTEEILLVSIPGKTISSKKSIFINVDDLMADTGELPVQEETAEVIPEPEPVRSLLFMEPDEEDPEDMIHMIPSAQDIPPVQQELPLSMTNPEKKGSADEAITRMEKKKAAHTRKQQAKDKPYRLPSPALLDPLPVKNRNSTNEIEAREKGELLIQIFNNFEIESRLIDTHIGPAVTQFEIRPDASVKISKINSLTDNIKMQLAAKDIRIEAPIPGRNAIGVEIPNAETTPVKMRELLNDIPDKDKKQPLLFFLGKDLLGRTVTCRLDKMPHLLIAGATGSGKSVCMNAIITSLLLRTDPDKVKMLLVDPKKVEFTPYRNIPHLIGPVINDSNQANNALKVIVQKMDERYNMFAACGVRNIEGYNAKVIAQDGRPNEDGSPAPKFMPYIVVIIDELADLMIVAGKEVEGSIQRITQLARAAGIHLIVATQRPSVNVITGVIKANIPSRIAFSVSSAIDSRTILDSHGAERLLGNGDMLYLPMGTNAPTRVQGVYVTDEEVQKIAEAVSEQKKPHYDDAFVLLEGIDGNEGAITTVTDDPMFEEVKEYVVEAQKASTSLLQRRFGIGYNRAARIIDALEENGIIGPAQGSKPREVYLKSSSSKNVTETGGTY